MTQSGPWSTRVAALGILAALLLMFLGYKHVLRIPRWERQVLFAVVILLFAWLVWTSYAFDRVKYLEERGLLAAEHYKALRAFGVEEFNEEGLHYFLELADGGVLYLTGQYLHEYREPRRFPCTEFTLRRLHERGRVAHVIDILCAGAVMEPELMARPLSPAEWDAKRRLARVEVIRDKTYDQIKREFTGGV